MPDRGRTLLGPALALVHTGQAPTRSALTSALDVTRATAGAISAELEALGLITVDSSPAGGGRGRPSHRLAIDPEGPVVIAAQLHADGLSVALAGLGGRIGTPVHHPLPAATDPVRLLRAVAAAGAELARASARRCLGAGLALPNPVTEPDGAALAALHFAWPSGTPVADLFAEEIRKADLGPRARSPFPNAVANDANLAALAEHRHGAGRGARHLLLVTSGHRGVGGALVIDGRLHTGSAGLALEVGHLTVDPQGRPCPCGNRGCLNVETDPEALLAAAGRAVEPGRPVLEQAREVVAAAYGPLRAPAVDDCALASGGGGSVSGRAVDARSGGPSGYDSASGSSEEGRSVGLGTSGSSTAAAAVGRPSVAAIDDCAADPAASGSAPDPAARAAVDRAVDHLGLGLAGLVNILNPDRIVLSGLHRDLLLAAPERLAAVVAERCLWGRSGRVPIVPAEVVHAGLVGAAELAWEPFLCDPQSVRG
nr:ROK family protein [Kitasatospora sp. MMS16-BH015]